MRVSIIIPVYNVEKYIESCISSAQNQSYTDLEIILIDDGATDRSPIICDRWAEKDRRIKVVHKNNGGLSSARNAGLDIATGDAVFFLDSDDMIAKDTIKKMAENMQETCADIVSCSFIEFYDNSVPYENFENVLFIQGDNSLFFKQIISNHACGKLIKMKLANEVRFPENRNYEDIATSHRWYSKANVVCHTKSGLLFYRQHEGTITAELSANNLMDIKWAYELIKSTYTIDDLYGFYLLTILYVLNSRLQRASIAVKKETNLKHYIRKEFTLIKNSIDISGFKDSPMYWKIILYKMHLSTPLISIKICFDKISRRK